MSNNTDSKYTKLGSLGYIGAQEDRELSFYRAAGILSTSVTDAESSYLNSVGFTTGSNEDRWKAYLISLGYTGSVDDMLPLFWKNNAGGGVDPNYSNVSLLLHMDGSNGSTTFTDNSPSPKTLTPSGNAQVNTSVVKYGTGSYIGNGSGGYLTATVPGGLGAGNITIEYWMYLINDSGYLFNSRSSGTGGDGIDISVQAEVSTAGNRFFSGYTGFSLNTWIHIALVRSGSTWYRFFNGTLYDTASNSTDYSGGTDFKIGGSPHGNVGYINGYIDDFRITVGVARYTANFTPPTAAFPNS